MATYQNWTVQSCAGGASGPVVRIDIDVYGTPTTGTRFNTS